MTDTRALLAAEQARYEGMSTPAAIFVNELAKQHEDSLKNDSRIRLWVGLIVALLLGLFVLVLGGGL